MLRTNNNNKRWTPMRKHRTMTWVYRKQSQHWTKPHSNRSLRAKSQWSAKVAKQLSSNPFRARFTLEINEKRN